MSQPDIPKITFVRLRTGHLVPEPTHITTRVTIDAMLRDGLRPAVVEIVECARYRRPPCAAWADLLARKGLLTDGRVFHDTARVIDAMFIGHDVDMQRVPELATQGTPT